MAEESSAVADLWTHRQTAAFLKVTPGTLFVWLSQGGGPRSYKIGGCRRYDSRDVQEFLRQRIDHPGAGAQDAARGMTGAFSAHRPPRRSGREETTGAASAATAFQPA